jgi:transcription initiation factor TFIIIB Brf1 subunit/transcription initiation factor TFIIB
LGEKQAFASQARAVCSRIGRRVIVDDLIAASPEMGMVNDEQAKKDLVIAMEEVSVGSYGRRVGVLIIR